jgi:hypothetical protein
MGIQEETEAQLSAKSQEVVNMEEQILQLQTALDAATAEQEACDSRGS